MSSQIKQAVVIVHGMGEHRPLDTLNGFIDAALAPEPSGERFFYSRPDRVTESYEARRYLAPRYPPTGEPEQHAQTEFYEYHWAHKMQGNRLSDMWPTFRKMLLRLPNRVPSGLLGVWLLFWLLIAAVAWAVAWGPLADLSFSETWIADAVQTVLGTGFAAAILTFLLARVVPAIVPGMITTSFVDVVRYLDTTPRSYQVRHDIRKGMVELLRGLHDSERYQRIVVVAHSLGAYIAYDGITHLWAQMNTIKSTRTEESPQGLADVEELASRLQGDASPEKYQAAQRALWRGIRAQGNPWLITDFISVGTPMYFADVLYTKNRRDFELRVQRRDLPTCPPQPEGSKAENNVNDKDVWFSYVQPGDRSLYHAAPFAVVRWTNMWFPTRYAFFGDWFGGPLTPLFGNGIKDIEIKGNRSKRWIPAGAHALYFKCADDVKPDSVTTHLRAALDLAASAWLVPTLDSSPPSRPRKNKHSARSTRDRVKLGDARTNPGR